jgi:rhamnulokinase
MGTRAYIAIDLGAESGRVIVGSLSPDGADASAGPKLELTEVHRFVHEPLAQDGGLFWDVPYIWNHILTGLRRASQAATERPFQIASIGVDTWGVDFALLDSSGELLGPPRCYRDSRCQQGVALVQEKIGYERLYQITGIQEMAINTLVQLAGAMAAGDGSLQRAHRLLMMPDFFHARLGGDPRNESSIASTSQVVDATTGAWSEEVLSKLGIPARLLSPPCTPGTTLGRIRPDLAKETGLAPDVRIVAPGSHDTASAVAGVPASGGSWAYLSSGTWSLLGVEIDKPILSEEARRAGFTNERGVGGKIRFLKNLVGLWLLQELRRDLEQRGTKMDYAQLTAAAAQSPQFRSRIDAFHPSLQSPGGAIEKLQSLARAAGDPEPKTPGELARCCFEALAMAYCSCLAELQLLTQRHIHTIHLVGGGTKNTLLNQMAADVTGRRILVGPAEATAAGNVLVQAMADGRAPDVAAIREIVRRSFGTVEIKPTDAARWAQEYNRWRTIKEPRA